MTIYVSKRAARMAGVVDPAAVHWTDVCHNKSPFVLINYDEYRIFGRWGGAERKRKFEVASYRRSKLSGIISHTTVGYYGTLERAKAAAAKWVKETEGV